MNCRACADPRLSTVFAMAPMPIAGDFADTADDARDAPVYPLEWRECRGCGLVNVWPDVPTDLSHYSYRASDVPALVRHHAEFARWLIARYQPDRHVEIGGNDGVLTRYMPWPTVNVDPSDAWVGPGYNEPFTNALASRLPKVGLVTASNSMAHFASLGDALDGVRTLLHDDGEFVMEVHDLDATLALGQWDTVYHEHAAEWSVDSLARAGALHGLRLVKVSRLSLHGGLLRAVFQPGLPRALRDTGPRRDYASLQRAYDERCAPSLPAGSVAYGAAGRATVYLYQTRPDVRYVVDGSPRRAGRYVPGTGTPIVAPERFDADQPPAALITAWNHADDIKARHPDYGGRWVTAW